MTALVFALAAPVVAQAPGASPPYRVIVHPHTSTGSVDRAFLAEVFLKKVSRWSNGEVIMPVDLAGDSSVRRKFSEDVLKRSPAAVRSYWQQLIFSGRNIPPPELDTDQAVIAYVAKHRGAIGYVSGGCSVDAVKVLSVR